MTIATTLPSIGPAPPQFRRPLIPEDLLPSQGGGSSNAAVRPATDGTRVPAVSAPGSADDQTRARPSSPVNNLGGSSAVALQVSEAGASPQIDINPELSEDELAAVGRLQDRDREVRAHENAHAAAGAGFTGTPSYEFTIGPDGRQYAVGGSVQIDSSAIEGDPEATIAKADIVRRAALAPAQPSGQDRSVAAAAEATKRQAQQEISERDRAEAAEALEGEDSDETSAISVQSLQQAEDASGFSSLLDEGEAAVAVPSLQSGGFFGQATPRPEDAISLNLLV